MPPVAARRPARSGRSLPPGCFDRIICDVPCSGDGTSAQESRGVAPAGRKNSLSGDASAPAADCDARCGAPRPGRPRARGSVFSRDVRASARLKRCGLSMMLGTLCLKGEFVQCGGLTPFFAPREGVPVFFLFHLGPARERRLAAFAADVARRACAYTRGTPCRPRRPAASARTACVPPSPLSLSRHLAVEPP